MVNELTRSLPPIPDEHIRLWRGINREHDGGVIGEFWTTDRRLAEDYASDSDDDDVEREADPTLFFLDVPFDIAATWPDHGGYVGSSRKCQEFVVPEEWQTKAGMTRFLMYVK